MRTKRDRKYREEWRVTERGIKRVRMRWGEKTGEYK